MADTPMAGMPQPPDQTAITSPDMLPPVPQAREPHPIALQKLKMRVAQLVREHQAALRQSNPTPVPLPAQDQPGADAQMRHGGLPGVTTVAPGVALTDYAAYPDSSTFERTTPYRVPTNRLSPPDMQVPDYQEAAGGHTGYISSGRGYNSDFYAVPDDRTGARFYRPPGANYYQPDVTPLRIADGSAGPRSVAELGHVNALLEGEASAADRASASKQGSMAPYARPRNPHLPEVAAGEYGLPYAPPLPQRTPGIYRGEIRSTNEFPLSDIIAERTESPLAGKAFDLTARLGRSTGEAAANLTMMPWAVETGKQLGEAATRDPLIQSIQSGDLFSSPAHAEDKDALQEHLTRQSVLQRQTEEARQRREAERKTGIGDNYRAADTEFKQLNDQLTAVGKMVEQEQYRRSPEYQLKMQQEAQRVAEEEKRRLAATPWRERNPAWANALPNYGIALSAGIPFASAAFRNARTFFPGSYAGQMRTAIEEAEVARAANDAPLAATRESELNALLRDRPTWRGELLKGGASALGGGALSAESQMFPDQWDYANLPEGEAKERARRRVLDPVEYLKRGSMGALTGASAYEAGSFLTPYREPPYARAQSLVDNPYTPPQQPPPPPRVQNRHPNGRFAPGWQP
jgi:hypothetical protein